MLAVGKEEKVPYFS